jgi:PhnB protein
MQLSTTLSFDGQCEEALKFYQECLGGNIQTMMTWGESPMAEHVPSDWRKKIIHATLVVGDSTLMASDSPPDRFEKPAGFSITIQVKDPAEAERIFKALSENGKITMPIQQTFWSPKFGVLVDRFGIPWMVNCEQAGETASKQAGR